MVLIRRHLFPLTPTDPNVAIHVEQIRTMHLMHYISRTSIHAISEWARVEYHYQVLLQIIAINVYIYMTLDLHSISYI